MKLKVSFYDGKVKAPRIQYFEQRKGKTYKYSIKKPFEYKSTPSGYVVNQKETEAVKKSGPRLCD